jgi:hypothetical protein
MEYLGQHPLPDEATRLDHVLADLRAGTGIPDDVMFRMNASTYSDVRSIVREILREPPRDDEWVTDSWPTSGTPDRPLQVGVVEWYVGDLLDGLTIESETSQLELPADVYRSASMLSGLHGLVGFDALTIRFLGGASTAPTAPPDGREPRGGQTSSRYSSRTTPAQVDIYSKGMRTRSPGTRNGAGPGGTETRRAALGDGHRDSRTR